MGKSTPTARQSTRTKAAPRGAAHTATHEAGTPLSGGGEGLMLPGTMPMFINYDQARAYTGLTLGFIERSVEDGSLPAFKDVSWKIKLADLIAWVERLDVGKIQNAIEKEAGGGARAKTRGAGA